MRVQFLEGRPSVLREFWMGCQAGYPLCCILHFCWDSLRGIEGIVYHRGCLSEGLLGGSGGDWTRQPGYVIELHYQNEGYVHCGWHHARQVKRNRGHGWPRWVAQVMEEGQ